MKKIIVSLSIIAAVAAIAVGATTAFFSDTETSTGNTFTAGSIDLMIDNECYLNGVSVGDCTWELSNLTEELFFDFEDLKPGDWGEDTVSMHVYDNNAWACVTFENLTNDDATVDSEDIDCTEPELEDDPDCEEPDSDLTDGDLAQELEFRFWADMCFDPARKAYPGDNKFTVGECEDGDDVYLMSGPASDILGGVTYTLADSNGSVFPRYLLDGVGALIGSHDYYIAKVWCFGSLDYEVDPMYGYKIWTCDGSGVNNAPQSDSLTGDIEFYAVQSRNNGSFQCSGR